MSRFSDYFYISKNDRTVLVWIIGIILCIILFCYFGENNSTEQFTDDKDSTEWNDNRYHNSYSNGKPFNNSKYSSGSNYHQYGYQQSTRNSSYPIARKPNLHPFDLNTATPAELSDLGFSERQIASVMKYRSKGGIYRHPEQMSKISGMTKGQYDQLLPYFTVSDDFKPASDFVTVPEHKANNEKQIPNQLPVSDNQPAVEHNYPHKLRPGETILINSADTTELMKVPGIGIYRAKQIVKYREQIGGFYSVEQLNDLQNLPADIQQYFTLDAVKLKKIRINHLSVNKMVYHPYITFFQAKAIYDYRQQKGNIHSLQELNFDKNFAEEKILRLEPYIDYD